METSPLFKDTVFLSECRTAKAVVLKVILVIINIKQQKQMNSKTVAAFTDHSDFAAFVSHELKSLHRTAGHLRATCGMRQCIFSRIKKAGMSN